MANVSPMQAEHLAVTVFIGYFC